jgi:trimeric autotransporter adhesin
MKAHWAQPILLCLSLLSACGSGSLAPGVGGSSRSPSLQSIQVAPSGPTIALGENQQFTATGLYSDGSTKDITGSAVWTSSNSGIATLSGSGFATSQGAGSATISATLSGVTGYGTLTVTKAILVSITVTPANPDLLLGTVQQFTATGTFSDQSTQDITGSVTWASSNTSVASIREGGLAAGLALGSLIISASSGSISGSTTVNVGPAALSSITVRPEKGKIAQLTSQQFQAVGTYTDGAVHNVTAKVSWTSSDTSVAKISSRGLAKSLAPGTTTITATLGSISGSTTLGVTDATIVSVTVTPSGKTIAPGTRLPFTAVGSFSDNTSQVITLDSTWASNNHAAATITVGGTAIAIGPGTANISATFNMVSSSATLNVSSATISSISVTPAAALLTPSTSVSCVATGTFSDGSTQVLTDFAHWTSSASTVASVGPGGGVTAHAAGSAIISAQFDGVDGDSTITVDSSQLTSLQISPPTDSIAQQATANFQAIGTFADGKVQDLTTYVLWTSSAPSVATINAGRATGLEPGTATIVALYDGQVGIADLTVTSATSASQLASPDAIHFGQSGFPWLTVLDLSDGTGSDVKPWVSGTSSANVAALTPAGPRDERSPRNDYWGSPHEQSDGNSCSEGPLRYRAPDGDQCVLFPESVQRPMLRAPMMERGSPIETTRLVIK